METPLWKIDSGEFAGWRIGDNLYDGSGSNVGYFVENIAYALTGQYIGELYNTDGWIGKNDSAIRPSKGAKTAGGVITKANLADRGGLGAANWSDPDF